MEEINHFWFDTKNKLDDELKRKSFIDRATALHDNLEAMREDAFRYFLITDYKAYNPTAEKSLPEDDKEEELLLTNPYLTLNVTASCVETATNKIAKSKPRITFITQNADREKRELARKMDNWVLKTFKKGKAWKACSKAFKSACVAGIGVVKLMPDKKGKMRFYKIPVFDVWFDQAFRGKGQPEEMGEIKHFTIYSLIEMYPSKEKEIKEAHGEDTTKSVKVYEGFKEYKHHFIATDKVTLLTEKWEKPLPYHILKWEHADQGVVSVGICKKLYAVQNAITYIMGKTFQSVKNFAVPRVFVNQGADPTRVDISNIVGEIIEMKNPEGKPPVFSTPPAMNNQVIEILNLLWVRAFEVIGISQLSAGGQIPRGLEKASGTALRNYQQVESERFQLIRTDYEETFIALTKKLIKMTDDSKLPVKRSEIIEAKDDITIWTSSILPDTPAGKLAMVGDFLNTGLVNREQALSLFESPDTAKFLSSETARLKAIDMLLNRAVDEGKKPNYRPALGLDLYLDRARKLYAELIVENEKTNKLALLEACIEELEQKVGQQTQIGSTINQITQNPNQPKPQPSQMGAIAGA